MASVGERRAIGTRGSRFRWASGRWCPAQHLARSTRRRRAAAQAAARDGALDDELADDGAAAPDAGSLRRVAVAELAAACDACLDPVDVELLLRWFDGEEDAAALGEALGLTAANVRVRKHRALRRLAAWFEARERGDG